MLKSVAETFLSETRAAFARAVSVASSTYSLVVSLPLMRLQPVISSAATVTAARLAAERMGLLLKETVTVELEQGSSKRGAHPRARRVNSGTWRRSNALGEERGGAEVAAIT